MTRAAAIRAQQQRPQLPAGWRVPPHPANRPPEQAREHPAIVTTPAPATKRASAVSRLTAYLDGCGAALAYAPALCLALGMTRDHLRMAMRMLEGEGLIGRYDYRQRQHAATEMRIVWRGRVLETVGWGDGNRSGT